MKLKINYLKKAGFNDQFKFMLMSTRTDTQK